MKRIILLLTVATLFSVSLFAQEVIYEPKFQPQSPEIMAQGGSYTANAHAFHSLYTNPAGFSTGKSSLTLAAANPWVYLFPDEDTIAALEVVSSDPLQGVSALNDVLTSSGTGLGAQVGFGFVGGGFGLGAIVMNDTFAYGQNTLGVTVDTGITAAIIAGVSFPIKLGPFTLTPGGAVRPMYRMRAYDVGISSIMGLLAPGEGEPEGEVDTGGDDVLAGMGLGIDLGLNFNYGPLTAALAIRDLGGTQFDFGSMSFDEAIASFEEGILPEGETIPETEYQFIIPASIHFGLLFHPDLGRIKSFFDPYLHAEYIETVGSEDEPLFSKLHVGAEIRLLQMLSLRAGLNQGYVTLGLGVKLLFLEAHVAYFGRELGSFPGERQGQGVTAEVALRF